MRSIIGFVVTLLVSSWVAEAKELPTKLCFTKYGTKSVVAPSSTITIQIPRTYNRKVTVTPTTTITPMPARISVSTTVTSTATTTIVTTPTQTVSTTETRTEMSTATTIIVNTSTVPTTVTSTSTGTTTVPTPASFTPLSGAPGYVAKRSLNGPVPRIRGRELAPRAGQQALVCPPIRNPGAWKYYPRNVLCATFIYPKTTSTRTVTAKTTATTTLPVATDTVTISTATTQTVVSAVAPVSSTTTISVTALTTITQSSTTTTTQTTTVTIEEATQTSYAACAANNVVNHANGNQGIYQLYYAGGSTTPTTNEVAISDPVECCGQCQQLTGCTGFAQYPGQARCFLFTNGQCDESQNFGQFYKTSSSFAPSDGYTIGNGQCGQLGNGGSG